MTVIAATLMMLKREENLTGGNRAESVVRVGMTVRKPVTEATPTVHAFLFYLRNAGYAGCPQAFGVDEQGRQVLEFIPGTKVHENGHNAIIDLFHVGVLIRAFHDASASYQAAANAIWNPLIASDGNEIVCHNDLAPWNLIIGPERWAFIDWDNAAPGTRLWDLAWAAVSFPPVETNQDQVPEAGELSKRAGFDDRKDQRQKTDNPHDDRSGWTLEFEFQHSKLHLSGYGPKQQDDHQRNHD
jgi:hypothetical protein